MLTSDGIQRQPDSFAFLPSGIFQSGNSSSSLLQSSLSVSCISASNAESASTSFVVSEKNAQHSLDLSVITNKLLPILKILDVDFSELSLTIAILKPALNKFDCSGVIEEANPVFLQLFALFNRLLRKRWLGVLQTRSCETYRGRFSTLKLGL
jgi:hypothetical protein